MNGKKLLVCLTFIVNVAVGTACNSKESTGSSLNASGGSNSTLVTKCTITAKVNGANIKPYAEVPSGTPVEVNLSCTGVVQSAALYYNGQTIPISKVGPGTAANSYNTNVAELLPRTSITPTGVNHCLTANFRLVDGTRINVFPFSFTVLPPPPPPSAMMWSPDYDSLGLCVYALPRTDGSRPSYATNLDCCNAHYSDRWDRLCYKKCQAAGNC